MGSNLTFTYKTSSSSTTLKYIKEHFIGLDGVLGIVYLGYGFDRDKLMFFEQLKKKKFCRKKAVLEILAAAALHRILAHLWQSLLMLEQPPKFEGPNRCWERDIGEEMGDHGLKCQEKHRLIWLTIKLLIEYIEPQVNGKIKA